MLESILSTQRRCVLLSCTCGFAGLSRNRTSFESLKFCNIPIEYNLERATRKAVQNRPTHDRKDSALAKSQTHCYVPNSRVRARPRRLQLQFHRPPSGSVRMLQHCCEFRQAQWPAQANPATAQAAIRIAIGMQPQRTSELHQLRNSSNEMWPSLFVSVETRQISETAHKQRRKTTDLRARSSDWQSRCRLVARSCRRIACACSNPARSKPDSNKKVKYDTCQSDEQTHLEEACHVAQHLLIRNVAILRKGSHRKSDLLLDANELLTPSASNKLKAALILSSLVAWHSSDKPARNSDASTTPFLMEKRDFRCDSQRYRLTSRGRRRRTLCKRRTTHEHGRAERVPNRLAMIWTIFLSVCRRGLVCARLLTTAAKHRSKVGRSITPRSAAALRNTCRISCMGSAETARTKKQRDISDFDPLAASTHRLC